MTKALLMGEQPPTPALSDLVGGVGAVGGGGGSRDDGGRDGVPGQTYVMDILEQVCLLGVG